MTTNYMGSYTIYLVELAYGDAWLIQSYCRSYAKTLTKQQDLEYRRGLPARVHKLEPEPPHGENQTAG